MRNSRKELLCRQKERTSHGAGSLTWFLAAEGFETWQICQKVGWRSWISTTNLPLLSRASRHHIRIFLLSVGRENRMDTDMNCNRAMGYSV